MPAILELRSVVKTYRTPAGLFTALKGVDLLVKRGEFVAVIGKSGNGETTCVPTAPDRDGTRTKASHD